MWFRKHVSDAAQQLEVIGFVKNLPDGSVYAEVEGTSTDIQHMVVACKTGSPHSRVEKVEVKEMEPTGSESDFRISY